ncbi:MAG: response regulator [Saprospiraceae bacterium]|nr:response regulator [Saprospiraceae bacterium]
MPKILVIEDHQEVRENLEELLELCDYEVVSAADGEAGIALATQERPDLILCDIMMPGIDGYEVLSRLSHQPETAIIPFIFLTARAEKVDIRRGMQMGADDYLTKPFEEEELLKAIRVRLDKNRQMQEQFQRTLQSWEAFLSDARQAEGLDSLPTECSRQIFQKGEVIYKAGEQARHLYFLVNGQVETAKQMENGDRQVVHLHSPGCFFGYLPLIQGTTYQEQTKALEKTEIAILSREDFLCLLLNNRTFSMKFIRMLANQVREAEEQLLKLVFQTTRRKVISTLLTAQPGAGEGSEDHISLQELRQQTNLAFLNLNLILHRLDHEKLIHFQNDFVQLIDPARLAAALSL